MDNLKKLSKEELKSIFAGKGDNSGGNTPIIPPGGNNNPPTGGNGDAVCGNEPELCNSPEWIAWRNCKGYYGTTPAIFFCH